MPTPHPLPAPPSIAPPDTRLTPGFACRSWPLAFWLSAAQRHYGTLGRSCARGERPAEHAPTFLSFYVAHILFAAHLCRCGRLQIAAGGDRSFIGAAMDIVAESGFRGLYSGLGAYMALWGAYSPLMFVMYEQGMQLVSSRAVARPGEAALPPPLAANFLVGSIAGMVAATVTSPLDVVKTRIQCQTPGSLTQYNSVLHGLTELTKHEGVRALFHGTLARSLNMGLSTGIMLTCYSAMRTHVGVRWGWLEPVAQPPRSVKQAALRPWTTEFTLHLQQQQS